MDRNETVELSRLAAFGEVPIHKALKAITDYCLEKGKSDIDTSVLREYLERDVTMLSSCLNQALEYFEGKFMICKLWSAPNPLSNAGQRKLLQIF
jgi:hypothetical protein